MKECNYGRIPPCYSGKKFRIHEELEKIKAGDETHDMVYELNRQMCDIGKAILTKKKNDMEEKKTKKMTKAEAFEYLKGKRVACDNFNCVAIQHKFFDVGIKWRGGSTKATDERGSFIFVDLNGYLTHCNSRTWFDTHEYEEISADDILSIEIVEEEKEPLDKWEEFASKVAKIQEALDDDEVCIITKTNYLTMTK